MLKLFDRWDTTNLTVTDQALKNYITFKPSMVPRTAGRYAKQQFYKSKATIVERLVNRLMVPGHKGKKHYITSGHCGGKSVTNLNIVEKTFTIIEQRLKINPVAAFAKAIENAAPRDEITTIEYGGARYPQAVDCSPQRRIDIAIRMMVQGAYQKSFGKKIKMYEALAEEIIFAYQLDPKSTAISKKVELERQADAAR
jgi:small subunit ribosomal protein S7